MSPAVHLFHSLTSLLKKWELRKLYREQALEERHCPLCGRNRSLQLLATDRDFFGIKTSQCVACGMVYSNPFCRPEFLTVFYGSLYRDKFKGAGSPELYVQRQKNLAARADYFCGLMESLGTFNVKGGAWVDIGCGEGTLLKLATQRHPAVPSCGVEPEGKYRAYAEGDLGLRIVSDMENLAPATFDLVTAIHVLEHVWDPQAFLTHVARLLTENGVALLDVPDAERYSGIEDIHLAHPLHFSRHTLKCALERSGLEVLRLQPHDPPTLPESIFVLAKRRNRHAPPSPASLDPDPMSEEVAKRIRSLQITSAAYFLKRVRNRIRV